MRAHLLLARPTALAIALASAIALFAGCDERPLTQLVVVVDTDLDVPDAIDRIELVILPPSGDAQRSEGALVGDGAITLPVTLGVVHRGGPLGPVEVTARGLRGTEEIVARRATVFMIDRRTMVLELHLERACVGIACDAATETCAHGECRDRLVAASELQDYDGTTPRLLFDGGGGDCLAAELCNGVDDDCDGDVDEGFDLETDPRHCGRCGVACPDYAGAMPACASGACGIACDEGWGDCDGEPRTGCETPLASTTDCGACAEPCSPPHASASCRLAECRVEMCAPGWGDCNATVADGCEMRLDAIEHCGACGSACAPAHAAPSCAGGACSYVACEEGWGDCDAMPSTGCETPLDTVADCGACGAACPSSLPNATSGCAAGRCGIAACEAGWADCNATSADGCETPLDTTSDCGGCGVACALSHASETCATGTCAIVSCDAGWGDCDAAASTGCESSLETATRCGACGTSCADPTPLCSASGAGIAACTTACAPGEMLCGADCVDVAASLDHCGGCDAACAPPNAVAACSSGACAIAACDPGWGDCNASATDGCETRLDTIADCGACGDACSLAGATERCAGGTCAVLACDPLRGDCDGVGATGCERPLDTTSDCGGCGVACALAHASESCGGGTCAIVACDADWADCDGMAANGCETPLDTLTTCGSCTGTCDLARASESCAGGTCTLTMCEMLWGDCDGVSSTGCEQSLRTVAHCGACGTACGPFPNATATCAAGTCEMACAAIWGDCSAAEPGCETRLESMTDCGACGVACPTPTETTTSCSGGACHIVSCTRENRADCNGIVDDGCETRTDRDEDHCGACGNACATDFVCNGGVCRPV